MAAAVEFQPGLRRTTAASDSARESVEIYHMPAPPQPQSAVVAAVLGATREFRPLKTGILSRTNKCVECASTSITVRFC